MSGANVSKREFGEMTREKVRGDQVIKSLC